MTNIHLINEYTDETIKIKHQERCAALLEDHGYKADDMGAWYSLPKDARWGITEANRKDYCIQVALRNDDKKMLDKLLKV